MFVTVTDVSHRDHPQVNLTANAIVVNSNGTELYDLCATMQAVKDSHSVPSCHDLINLTTRRQDCVVLSHDWKIEAHD